MAKINITRTELIPKEVRTKVKKWSDYIDYWAVDWQFQNDTYDQAGRYRILVKVVDIFGNDTSQVYDVEV
jgi:adenine-specific DNA-methyltransferase